MPYYASQDVIDAITDPDFQVPITVLSSTVVVGAGGLASATAITPGGVVTMAVVYPNTGYVLIQDGSGNSVQGDIDIITQYPLSTGGNGREPDVVIWNDTPHRLIRAEPWLYGAGFTHAVGKLAVIDPTNAQTGPAPTPAPGGGFLG